jgi:hypothetical protein
MVPMALLVYWTTIMYLALKHLPEPTELVELEAAAVAAVAAKVVLSLLMVLAAAVAAAAAVVKGVKVV